MILEQNTIEEYHKNGQLAYTETIAKVSVDSMVMFPNRRIHPDGYYWIRVGKCAKYYDNGQLAWEMNYDEFGNGIVEKVNQYRKDGTVIVY